MTWQHTEQYIPPFFRDNGPSTPWLFVFFLSLTTIIRWGRVMMASYWRHARIHDFGYSYARLPGSGVEHMTKAEWDTNFREGMADDGFPKLAKLRHKAVDRFGMKAWDKNLKMMMDMGDASFVDYLKRKGHPDWKPTV